MEPLHTPVVVIGKDIHWKEVKGHGFRVDSFTPLSQVENGIVKEPAMNFMPYASLSVDCPAFRSRGGKLIILVTQKEDFRHFWELYQERGVNPEEEVIVTYALQDEEPIRQFVEKFPHLRIRLMPKGALEVTYDFLEHKDKWQDRWDVLGECTTVIAEWDPVKGRIR